MKPDRTQHLYSLREEIAALSIVNCRMSHERVLNKHGSILPIKSKLFPGSYERIGLCSYEVRAQRLGCSHTTARIKLADAVDELRRETDLADGWSQELRYLDNEIHLLDHRKGEAETILARTRAESCLVAGPAHLNATLAQAEKEVRDMEQLHDEFVGRIGALKDRVIAEIDRLMGMSHEPDVIPARQKSSAPGVGRMPQQWRATIEPEGILLFDEGIGGSVTYRDFRSPGRRSSWRKVAFSGSIALTKTRLLTLQYANPVINVPLDDERFKQLRISVDGEETLLVAFDASLFHNDWSGTIEYRFRTSQAQTFFETLRERIG